MTIVEKVKQHVLKRYEERNDSEGLDMYETHVKYVAEYSKELAKQLGADIEVVEISALLHDIARIDGSKENHHIDGAAYAVKLLTELKYDPIKIEQVEECITSHRGSMNIPQKTVEAKCLASADAMAHFRNISEMFYFVYKDLNCDIEEGKKKLIKKFTESYNKMIPEARNIVEEKYQAVMKVLE
ncbi:HD domain-containing protein [Candidatus Dojkabacteria bacterium]|jgi:uncharacterized protein|nr:HD domain-containing protein [Candidatus Dojkabacteria bacterium]